MDYLKTDELGSYLLYADEEFKFLQDAWRNHINALAQILPNWQSEAAILSGCQITFDNPTYSVAAGVILWKGEVVLVDAQSGIAAGTHRWYIEEGNHAFSPMTMQDGTDKNVHKVRRAKLTNVGQGDEILNTAILDMRTTAWTDVGTTPAFATGFLVHSNTAAYQRLRFRTRNGYLEIEGHLEYDNTANTGLDVNIFVLPDGYRPKKHSIGFGLEQKGTTNKVVGIVVFNTGFVNIQSISGVDNPGDPNNTVVMNIALPLF